jgi:group I intron endonuclease
MAVIYKITCVATDDFYVGSTIKPKRRRWEHWDALKKNQHHCVALQIAWNEYGEDAFDFEIIEEVEDESKLLGIEDMYLAQYAGNPDCYNTALSTQIPCSTQREVREKITQSLKGYYAENEHPRQGRKHTPETLAKIATNRTPPRGEAHYRYGKTLDEETRKKIGDTQRGKKKGPRTFTPEGLARAQENMRRNAREQKPMDFSAVLAKFPTEIQERYDFSNAVYAGALVRIEHCLCSIHGEFSQYAAQFRKGRGCPSCGQDQRSATRSAQMKQSWADPEERERLLQARQKTLDTPLEL